MAIIDRKDQTMYKKEGVIRKLKSVFPEIDMGNANIQIHFDAIRRIWTIDIRKVSQQFRIHLDAPTFRKCMTDSRKTEPPQMLHKAKMQKFRLSAKPV